MTYARGYWLEDSDAPFAALLQVVDAYCHPEYGDYDELKEAARNPERDSRMPKFKEQLRDALADPSQIPGKDTLHDAAHFSDGTDERFLRRLWRDLYPGEPVPGGDEEFREQMRQLIHGEVDDVPDTVDYYDDWPPRRRTPEELRALGREIWQKFYPEEPVP